MSLYQGDYAEDATVYIMFNTFTSDDPSASSTITNFINTDVHIHKDDDLTQRNNAAGITVSVNFDGITGSHMIKIDTNDNTVAGFWVTAKDYFVRIEGTTVDGATVNAVVGHFSIENRYNPVTDYDGPTKAEMDTAHALLATEAKQDIIDTNVDQIETAVITNAAGTDIAADIIALKAETVNILADTDDIGIAGAGLSAVPWNSSWDTEVESEVTDSLVAHNLDHLCKTATVGADMTTEVVDNTILSRILASGDTSVFDPTTDSLQDIRDKLTDIETDTAELGAAVGASLSADVAAVKAETAVIVNDTDVIDDGTSGLVKIASDVAAILTDTGTTLDTLIKDVPTVAEFNARSDPAGTAATPAEVNTEVLDVLNTDTFAEPGDEAPVATATLVNKISYLYKFLRNKIETTATKIHVYNDAGANKDHTSTISDDATTFTRGEFGAGE